MTAGLALALLGVVSLIISILLFHRGAKGISRGFYWLDCDASEEEDVLALEAGARIFDRKDSDFVAAETGQEFARMFLEERRVLAIDWLRQVRSRVTSMVRIHRLQMRGSPEARTAGELGLLYEFLLFQLTSGALYCLISARGAHHAASLVESSLETAGRLRKAAGGVVPVTRPTVEIVED